MKISLQVRIIPNYFSAQISTGLSPLEYIKDPLQHLSLRFKFLSGDLVFQVSGTSILKIAGAILKKRRNLSRFMGQVVPICGTMKVPSFRAQRQYFLLEIVINAVEKSVVTCRAFHDGISYHQNHFLNLLCSRFDFKLPDHGQFRLSCHTTRTP
jgi:hypothetical protein